MSEWQWYAILTLAAVVIASAGIALNVPLLAAFGVLVLLFSLVGIVYGVAKERSR